MDLGAQFFDESVNALKRRRLPRGVFSANP